MKSVSSAPVSPAIVFDTLTAYQRTAGLRTAIELDLFRAIGEGPNDVASLARRCGASERGIRILCDYLTVIGLIAKEGSKYIHTPASSMFLDPRSPACLATTAQFLSMPELTEPFTRLTEIVRSGRTVLQGQESTVFPYFCLSRYVLPLDIPWPRFTVQRGLDPPAGVLIQ